MDSAETKSEDLMPFSEPQQDALLGYLIDDDKFFQQAHNFIQSNFFLKDYNQRIYQAKLNFIEEFERMPSSSEIKDCKDFLLAEPKTQRAIWGHIDYCKVKKSEYKLDFISKSLAQWVKACKFKAAHTHSAKLYNGHKPLEAFEIMKVAIKDIEEVNFEKDIDVGFENPPKIIETLATEYNEGSTFGIKHVDKLLNPMAPNGALIYGDTTVLMAPSNIGKTSTVITVAMHNIMRGKHILLLTHEGKVLDLQMKILCSIMGVTREEMWQNYKDPKFWAKYTKTLMFLNYYLTFIPYTKAGMLVEDVAPIIRRYQDRKIQKRNDNGKGYDMLIDDYPATLSTKKASKGQFSKRHIDEEVYGYFVQIGIDCNFHVLTCIQTNREGSKINSNKKDSVHRMLSMEDVHESFGPMQKATNVITINRTPEDIIRNRVCFHICKSRSGTTGWTIVCNSDYRKYVTHSDKMGGVWYNSNASLSGKLDSIMEQGLDREIPYEEYNRG